MPNRSAEAPAELQRPGGRYTHRRFRRHGWTVDSVPSSRPPRTHGSASISTELEKVLSAIALGLVESGYGQLIIAGGETSGAVIKALGIKHLRIGREIAPGVPWTTGVSSAGGHRTLALALKSGNFGADDFFLDAWRFLHP